LLDPQGGEEAAKRQGGGQSQKRTWEFKQEKVVDGEEVQPAPKISKGKDNQGEGGKDGGGGGAIGVKTKSILTRAS